MGQYRFVLVFPVLRIAIKLPRIRIIDALCLLKRIVQHACWKKVFLPRKVRGGLPDLLFGGIINNWGEFWFFLKTRHPFVQPTYFSFFGLFNVQRAGEELDKTTRENLRSQLFELSLEYSGWTGSVFTGDSHHWETVANFCFWQGRLRILDYGRRRTQEVIISYGNRIDRDFDPNYGVF